MMGVRKESELLVTGSIIDSWVEPSGPAELASRLVLQVAPRGRPKELMIVEVAASLVGDTNWLEDLGENLCHGSPVAALCRPTWDGLFHARTLQLSR